MPFDPAPGVPAASPSSTAPGAPTDTVLFDTVLVANRGEIAVRVIRTLRRLGIRSVAVFSDADADARHVREADVAVRVGPATSLESYLHAGRILDAARQTGAQAVHPGYGFLSENAGFARACAEVGVVFVGPSPQAIELMGDKIAARRTVAAAGVPVVPGCADPGLSDRDLLDAAARIGYPVLVKPSAGGGGKGMRRVDRADDLGPALVGARREAAAAFGDDTLYLERYLVSPRHLEVQILADSHGAVVHLGERECSLQRRHQKVIEEAPSPFLDAAGRERLGAAAVATARSVAYAGAGTVEFIVSAPRPDEVFFMEMNTRLQVEHPVTEMVTGLDLVEQQLRVAAGGHLAIPSEARRAVGHAVEARIYAEDPARGFVPAGGRIVALREPSGEGIRVDSGVVAGQPVATEYDPMLAKVIAWGPDRATALARLRHALGETVVLGVVTNVAFLRALVGHPDVVAGRLDTGLIERELASLVRLEVPAVAHAAYALSRLADAWPPGPVVDPWDVPSGWRPGWTRPSTYRVHGRGPGSGADPDVDTVVLSIAGRPDGAQLRIGTADPLRVTMASLAGPGDGRDDLAGGGGRRMVVSVNGLAREATTADDADGRWVFVDGEAWVFDEVVPRRRASAAAGAAGSEVRSPMPGTVIEVRVVAGTPVRAGQALLVVEAMKMEHVLTAPLDGVATPLVAVGDSVALGQVVGRVEPVTGSPGPGIPGAGTAGAD